MDLLKPPKYTDSFTKDVQSNLRILHKELSSKFELKYKKYKIPLHFYKETSKTKTKSYYVIQYDKLSFGNFYPLRIMFVDVFNKIANNNNAYINLIHRTDDISGSTLVEIAIALCKLLNVNKISIDDGATIECNGSTVDLSLLKLIEGDSSFYMKFGFKYIIPNDDWKNILFNTDTEITTQLNINLLSFKSIKNIDLLKQYSDLLTLLTNIIKTQSYNNTQIEKYKLWGDNSL